MPINQFLKYIHFVQINQSKDGRQFKLEFFQARVPRKSLLPSRLKITIFELHMLFISLNVTFNL